MGICPSLCHTGDETNFVLTVHVQQLGLLIVELWNVGRLKAAKFPSGSWKGHGELLVAAALGTGLIPKTCSTNHCKQSAPSCSAQPMNKLSLSGARGSWRGVGGPGASLGRSVD